MLSVLCNFITGWKKFFHSLSPLPRTIWGHNTQFQVQQTESEVPDKSIQRLPYNRR
jgi:hypothetical protein